MLSVKLGPGGRSGSTVMLSLRARLFALWLMLAVAGAVTAFLLLQFYRQSSNALVSRTEDTAARACRDIADRYAFFAAGWHGAAANEIDDAAKKQLSTIVATALARSSGVEGGLWQAESGSLAYAFPTYEGSGPKTDVPAAELAKISDVNAEALRGGRPVTVQQVGRSQVLIVHACPLPGPLATTTAWTMARVFTGQGAAYNQLLAGLLMLAVMVAGSAVWLGWSLYAWSRRVRQLKAALDGRDVGATDLPALPATGERELDRLVDALNATGGRLAEERRRATTAERMAAIGRLAAGLAHEIRNPIAAMRLKAENALAVPDDQREAAALRSILEQVGRLDGLLHDLLAMTQRKEPKHADVDLKPFLTRIVETHCELAATRGVSLKLGSLPSASEPPHFDPDQMTRALENLILNALQNTPAGGTIMVQAAHDGGRLQLRVCDTGPGIPSDIRHRLFEPFVTGRPDGTGLGLAIVREIAGAHGGEARLVPGIAGAVFEIETPWRPS
jgi:signal transduction histidine kinase